MALAPFADRTLGLVLRNQVDLRKRDDLRQGVEPRAVSGQLAADRLVARLGISLGRRHVHKMHEQPATLEMGEELVAEAGALGGALDQTRNVGQNQLAILQLDGAQIGLEGGERVSGDLWIRPGKPREE